MSIPQRSYSNKQREEDEFAAKRAAHTKKRAIEFAEWICYNTEESEAFTHFRAFLHISEYRNKFGDEEFTMENLYKIFMEE